MTTETIKPVSFKRFGGDFDGFSGDLGGSFARYGFAVISDHDLPQARIEAALAATKAFFALPEAVKRAYVVGTGGQRGYTPFGVETAKGAKLSDLKEFWHVGRDLPAGHRFADIMAPNIWPDAELPEFRPAFQALFAALQTTGLRVLKAIAVHLGQPQDFAGPMAKQHRMAAVTLGAVLGFGEALAGGGPGLPGLVLWAILIGSLATAARRLWRIAARLGR